MSDSVSTKSVIVVNAIAITTALAIISGYLPLKFTPVHFEPLFQQNSTHR